MLAVIVAGIAGLAVVLVLGTRFFRVRRTRVDLTQTAYNWPHDAEIEEMVRAGRSIYAIKRHRELFRSDLAEAKHAIGILESRLHA